MADEIIANKDRFDFVKAAPQLLDTNLFVLTSDDGFASMSDALSSAIKADGGTKLKPLPVPTDHRWSDARIRQEREILRWVGGLKPAAERRMAVLRTEGRRVGEQSSST